VPVPVSKHPHDWSYEMTRRKNSGNSNARANGDANGQAGANGTAAALETVSLIAGTESDGLAAHLHRAGSDDSTADFAASSASSAGARASRDAYAELAQADPAESAEAEGKWLRPPGAASRNPSETRALNRNTELSTSRATNGSGNGSNGGSGGTASRASRAEKAESAFSLTPPGTEPLPLDGATFVEAVHERVDLIALEEQLLRSADEKIVQRELAYLRELRYGKTASFSTDDDIPPRLIFESPDSMSS
jgi:hypothetical protein